MPVGTVPAPPQSSLTAWLRRRPPWFGSAAVLRPRRRGRNHRAPSRKSAPEAGLPGPRRGQDMTRRRSRRTAPAARRHKRHSRPAYRGGRRLRPASGPVAARPGR